MLPHDLPASSIPLPPGDRRSAVYLSGNEPRHLRLGYSIQRRFPGLLKAWWTHSPPRSARWSHKLAKARRLFANSQAVSEARAMLENGQIYDLAAFMRRKASSDALRQVKRMVRVYAGREKRNAVEEEMFGREVDALKQHAELHPEPVDSPNSPERVRALEALSPYFIITFGGPLLRGKVLQTARGLAINQHAGWSPALKGASTTETALYHRQLGWVGNTVHIMDTFADAGAILRRSTATLHPDDSVSHCFLSVVALGNKMMLEVIEEALTADELVGCAQPPGGQTVLNIDFSPTKRDAIRRDFAQGWLGDALRIVKDF